MGKIDFERLDVFQVALDMVVTVDHIAESLPPNRGYMRKQLRRAANSVALNIAEGAGEFKPNEKARFYRMARRSATETAAQVLVAARLELLGPEEARRARNQLHRLIAMLVRLISSCRSRGDVRRP